MQAVIQAQGLAKTFRIGFFRKKVVALRDATFEMHRKEVFGLIGPNGAGKTTTIKILTGLVSADSGTGTLCGAPVGSKASRQNLGYLPESPYFYEYLSVAELLDFHGALFGMSRKERQKRADELIELVGLNHAKNRPLRKYSKGMLQRAGLAQALLPKPDLVILDEPQTGLDPIGRAEVTRIIRDLKREGRSVFFSSHILSDVEQVCDRVALMHQGRVRAVGTLGSLLETRVIGVEISVEGLGEEHRPEIESLGMRWENRADQTLVLVGDDVAKAQEALQMIARRGALVHDYTERHDHLEDLFVRAVQGKLEDDPTPSITNKEES